MTCPNCNSQPCMCSITYNPRHLPQWRVYHKGKYVGIVYGSDKYNALSRASDYMLCKPSEVEVQRIGDQTESSVSLNEPENVTMQKAYVVITENRHGNTTAQSTVDELAEAKEIAARSVINSSEYLQAHIYARVETCRAPAPEVEWKDTAPRQIAAPASDK